MLETICQYEGPELVTALSGAFSASEEYLERYPLARKRLKLQVEAVMKVTNPTPHCVIRSI